jgi:hypothetical protein
MRSSREGGMGGNQREGSEKRLFLFILFKHNYDPSIVDAYSFSNFG